MTKIAENYFVLAPEKLRFFVNSRKCIVQPASSSGMEIQTGVYQHFKGRYYLVIGTAVHSETNEPMVVYQPLYGAQRWFVRPAAMFTETVERDGEPVQRFRWVGEVV